MTKQQIERKKIKAALAVRLHTADLDAVQVEEIEFLIRHL